MKTADLNRSKRLKELGWEQEGFLFHCMFNDRDYDTKPNHIGHAEYYQAPTAGEMIEWLLGDWQKIDINNNYSVLIASPNRDGKVFVIKDGLCNALADAVIWVLERKK